MISYYTTTITYVFEQLFMVNDPVRLYNQIIMKCMYVHIISH